MKLSREAIQRMVGAGQSLGSVGAGGGSETLGFATQDWVNQNYLSLDFFNALFQAKTANDDVVAPNSGDTATIASIEAMFGFWTDQYLSALGLGNDSGGGATTLSALNDVNISNLADGQMLVYDLASNHWVNRTISLVTSLSSLTDVVLTSLATNQILKYNGTNWVNADLPAAYTLPLAASGTRGGVQIGYTTDGTNRNYAVLLSSEKMYVNVPWENTIYSNGTGLSLTGTTFAINSTYQTYISNGNTAYGWGNHADAGYLLKSGGTMTGTITFNIANGAKSIIFPSGEYIDSYGNIGLASGSSNWSVSDSNGNHLIEVGSGGSLFVKETVSAASLELKYTTPFIDFHFNNSSSDYTTRLIEEQSGVLKVVGNLTTTGYLNVGSANGSYITIGAIRLVYDSSSNAIKVIKSDGTNANLYATGGISALGANTESGGGGDVTWALLASPATGGRTIHQSYISGALSNYLLLSGGTMTGGNISWNSDSHGLYLYNGCGIEKWSGYGPSLVAEGNNLDFWIRNGTDRSNNAKIIHSQNIGSQSVAYANSAGSVAWSNVSGRPSSMPASDVYAWAKASTKPSYTLDEVADGSIRKLANYLPLSGGTMSGAISFSQTNGATCLSFSNGERMDCYGNIRLGSNSQTWSVQNASGNAIISAKNNNSDVEFAGSIKSFTLSTTSVELSFSTPFIDFHYNYSTSDYTSRIIEYSAGTVTCECNLRAYSYANTSDIRQKKLVEYFDMPIETIANAPSFKFYWKNKKWGTDLQIGTSAQYWQARVGELVSVENDSMQTLSMQYGVAALISAISIAKKVMTHEEKIALLETRVSALEKENDEQAVFIATLQEELIKYKAA